MKLRAKHCGTLWNFCSWAGLVVKNSVKLLLLCGTNSKTYSYTVSHRGLHSVSQCIFKKTEKLCKTYTPLRDKYWQTLWNSVSNTVKLCETFTPLRNKSCQTLWNSVILLLLCGRRINGFLQRKSRLINFLNYFLKSIISLYSLRI